jgi:hypothetical protein
MAKLSFLESLEKAPRLQTIGGSIALTFAIAGFLFALGRSQGFCYYSIFQM